MLEAQLAKAFDELWSNSGERNWIPGRLGIAEGADEDIDIIGKPGYVVVSKGFNGDLGVTMAHDKIGVSRTNFQHIRMRRELGELVIREAELSGGGDGGGTPGPVYDHFLELLDVQPTGWDNNEVPTWSSSLGKFIPASIPAGSAYAAGNGISISGITIAMKPRADSGLAFTGSQEVYINAGNGLGILSNVLSLKLATPSGLTFSGGGIKINVGRGLELVGDLVRVDEDFAFLWAGVHQFNAIPNFNNNINFMGGVRTITSTNALNISPTGDLTLSPSATVYFPNSKQIRTIGAADNMSGIKGFRFWDYSDLGTGNDMMLTIAGLKADEMTVRKFTADEARVRRGEMIIAYSYGDVQEKFTMPPDEGLVDVWFEEAPGLGNFQLFGHQHWLLLRTVDMTSVNVATRVWFSVIGVGANNYVAREDANEELGIPSRQKWRLQREFGGVTGQIVKPHETIVDYGLPKTLSGSAPGQGVIEMSALYKSGGPYIKVDTFESVAGDSPSFLGRVRMGNLSGTVDYGTNTMWGFAAGDDLSVPPIGGFSGVTIDQIQGARLFNTDIRLYEASIVAVYVSRPYGVSFRNDDTQWDNEARNIAWYDNIPESGNLSTSFATARIGSWGLSPNRVMTIGSYGVDKASVHLESIGSSGANQASFSLYSAWWGDAHGYIGAQADYFTYSSTELVGGDIKPRFRIGGDGGSKAISHLHVWANDPAFAATVGITVENDGADALLHWKLTGGQSFTAGIDSSLPNKPFKINAGDSIRGLAAITIDPVTGVVTINGLSGSGTGSLVATGGDGIDIVGTDIRVDGTVVRTDRTVNATVGGGLSGGGSLAGNIAFQVDGSVVRTGLVVDADGAIQGGGPLNDDILFHLNVLPNSGLLQTTQLTLDPLIAGTDLSMDANHVLHVDATIARSAININTVTGSGLLGGGNLTTDRSLSVDLGTGLMMVGNKITVNPAVAVGSYSIDAGAGLSGGGPLTSNPSLSVNAGFGLTFIGDVLAVDQSVVIGSRQIIAGAGLSGGGYLTGDVTLNVIALAASGLVVNVDDIAIKYPSDAGLTTDGTGLHLLVPGGSGLIKDATGLHLDPNIAGGGLGYSSGTIGINAGVTMEIVTDILNVNQGHTFNWLATGSHTFNALTTFNNNITFTTADRIISTAGSLILTVAPGGDLVLAPVGQDVLPGGSGYTDLGDYNRKWRSLYVSELIAESLVAQEVMATIGGRIIVAPTSQLVAALTASTSDVTLHVKHNSFFSGDYVRLQTAPGGNIQTEVLKITSGVSGSSPDFTYTVVRNVDDTVVNAWEIGDAVVSLGGSVGQGYLELTSTSTIHNHLGPTITMYGRIATTNWYDVKPLVSMGNLESFVDYSTTAGFQYGFAVGNDLTLTPSGGFAGITVDRDKGVRLFNTVIELYETSNLVVALDKTRGISFEAAVPLAYSNTTPYRYPRSISWYVDLNDLTIPVVDDPPITNYRPPVAKIGVDVNGTYSYDMHIEVLGDMYYATPGRPGMIELRSSAATLTLGATGGWSFSLPFLASRGDIYGDIDGVRIGDADYTVSRSTLTVHEITTATGATAGVTIQQGGTGDASLSWLLTGGQGWYAGIDNSDADKLKIGRGLVVGTTPTMTFDISGNVGIGTATPTGTEAGSRLTVEASDASTVYTAIINTGAGQAGQVYRRTGAVPSRWVTHIPANVDQFRIYSGTLGNSVAIFGATSIGLLSPDIQATNTNYVQVHIGSSGLIMSSKATVNTYWGDNAYNDGVWKRRATGFVGLYGQTGGSHVWYTAASGAPDIDLGTALVEFMRLTSNGSLGIGVNPTAKLDVVGDIRITANIASGIASVGSYTWYNQAASPNPLAEIEVQTAGQTYNSTMFFKVRAGGAPYEAMRINASGHVNVGLPKADSGKFVVTDDNAETVELITGYGFAAAIPTVVLKRGKGTRASTGGIGPNDVIGMYAASALTSSSTYPGNATTNPGLSGGYPASINWTATEYWTTSAMGNEFRLYVTQNLTTTPALGLYITHARQVYMAGVYNHPSATAANVYISSDGWLARATSSRRYKTNIQDMPLDKYGDKFLMGLRPVIYDGIRGEVSGLPGFIAEEMDESGGRSLVDHGKDGQADGIHYTSLIPVAISGMQRLIVSREAMQAEITELKARLRNLEERMN